jgi:hypothetical protein
MTNELNSLFDAAIVVAKQIGKQHLIEELEEKLSDSGKRCGDCSKFMIAELCPREGSYGGCSMNMLKCEQFEMGWLGL